MTRGAYVRREFAGPPLGADKLRCEILRLFTAGHSAVAISAQLRANLQLVIRAIADAPRTLRPAAPLTPVRRRADALRRRAAGQSIGDIARAANLSQPEIRSLLGGPRQ